MCLPKKDPHNEAHPELNRIMEQMGRFARKQVKLHHLLARAEELADQIEIEGKELIEAMDELIARSATKRNGAPAFGRPHAVPGTTARESAPLDAIAANGVCSVSFEWMADGSAMVRIGGDDPFDAPCVLARILDCIAADEGEDSGDAFVGWKSTDDIRLALRKQLGADVSPHALVQNISRLRGHLYARRINPKLVQSRKGAGYRFAVRRKETLRCL